MLKQAAARCMSTAVAPAAPHALLTPAAAAAAGGNVTMPWNRFNVVSSAGFTVAEARKSSALSSVADATSDRVATIYKAGRHAMSSGIGASRHWGIRFNHTRKWANPLMGWLSGTDTLQALTMHLRFESPEQAILAAERNGWKWQVGPSYEHPRGKVVNEYQANFLSYETQARMKAMGPRKARVIFEQPTGRKEGWVNWRRSTFGAEPWVPKPGFTDKVWTGDGWPAHAARPVVEGREH